MEVEARLRAFAAVARAGSFSEAATRLYVSQPAVSKHVAALERELGVQLVERGRSGAILTPAGRLLSDYVLRAEALLANARRALEAGADSESGTLSIAAAEIPGTYLLPELLARFREMHPAVELEFRVASSAEVLDLVRGHRAELAVVAGATIPPELDSESLVDDEVVLIGPPALGGRRLRPADLATLTWVTTEESSPTRDAIDATRWQLGLRGMATLTLPSSEAVKLAVAAGGGVAAISRFALALAVETGTLAVLDVPRWRLSRPISVVRAREVPLSPPAERFLAQLRERFALAELLQHNSNLPAMTTTIVGRESEADELCGWLRGSAQVVTLTGPGGSGKTRLACEVASVLVDDFRDGVYLVDLAPVRTPELVLPAIRRALLIPDRLDLETALSERRMLLLLDNFEHVQKAARSVSALAAAAPAIKWLITSRLRLRIAGEQAFRVEPLALQDAVTLFAERAIAVDPAFVLDEHVSRICKRLEGLPLAIELAAARTKAIPPAELLERLEPALSVLIGSRRDAPSRQRTLAATIRWSYELLQAAQQRLTASLSVFRGGWTLDAAAVVCEASEEVLGALVESSLVRRADHRYAFLETVREFAAGELDETGEAGAFRARHAEYFRQFAKRTEDTLRAGEPEEGPVGMLEREIDNLNAAVEFGIETGDATLVREITAALPMYWIVRGLYNEARTWLERALALTAEQDDTRRRLLSGLARIAYAQGDHELAVSASDEAGELAMSIAGATKEFELLHEQARAAAMRGDLERADGLYEEALVLATEADNGVGTSFCRLNLASIATDNRQFDRARALLEENLPFVRDRGQSRCEAYTMAGFATMSFSEDLPEATGEYAVAGVERAASISDHPLAAYCLDLVAFARAAAGDRSGASLLLGATEAVRDAMGASADDEERRVRERALPAEDINNATRDAWARGRELTLDEAIELVAGTR